MKSAFLKNRKILIADLAKVAVILLIAILTHPALYAQVSSNSNKYPAGFSQDSIKQVKAGLLDVGYIEAGSATGQPVVLLHGWPYDINSYSEVTNILVLKGYHVFVPYLRGFGTTRFLSDKTARNAQQSVVALDIIAFMDALNIDQAIIGGFDWGARTADIIAVLYPDRCKALVSVSGYLIGSPKGNAAPLTPKAELAWWYQYYFATQRGEQGYQKNTREFAKLIWQTASPEWKFTDSLFNQDARSFDNPDHVAIVMDNYRWRLGITAGEKKYDRLENILATAPAIKVPTVTLEGSANGAPHPQPAAYRSKFTGKYVHHTIGGSIGHDLPQEAPEAFADAVVEADQLAN